MSESLVDAVVDRVRTMAGETIVVVDPDGMVRSLPVLDALRAHAVDAVSWEEPLESRLGWENSGSVGGRLVVVEQPYRADVLPADVMEATSRRVAVSANHLFGPLDRSIVIQLDWADREAAFVVAAQLPGKALTAIETASQLLRRLYRFDPDVMNRRSPLLEGLLRHHRAVRGAPISRSLAEAFSVAVGDPLPGLRTVDAVLDRSAFVAWLQASWDQAATDPGDGAMRALLLDDGPAQLLDDYFDDGVLRPIESEASVGTLPFGVSNDPGVETRLRVTSGIAAIGEALDGGSVTYDGWRAIAERWADVLAAEFSGVGEPDPNLGALRIRLNEAFVGWLFDHYAELATLPA